MNEPGRLHDTVKQNEREIRRLRLDMDEIASGGVVRATSIGGIIPAGNRPVAWWFNANLLGLGDELELLEGEGVWISGSFVDGRAYYHIGAYCAPPCGGGGGLTGTVAWYANGEWFCDGLEGDLQEEIGVWISGVCVGDRAVYHIGAYPPDLSPYLTGVDLAPYISGVDWHAEGAHFGFGPAADLQGRDGVWVTGSMVGDRAQYLIGYEDLATINFIIDGGGEDILTGTYGQIRNRSGPLNLRDVTLLADPTGTIAVDIWVCTYDQFPPDDSCSICAAAVPTITAGLKYFDDTLTGWRTGIDDGEIFSYHVDSCTGIERVSITLRGLKRP